MDAKFVETQKKILWLFQDVEQINPDDEYYKIGKDYDIDANKENYNVSISCIINSLNIVHTFV